MKSERSAGTIREGEAYFDIVWRQFKKNGSAYISLWLLVPIFLLAIFAPAIASNQPFVFFDGDEVLFPWVRSVFNPEEGVDFVFNMALLGFFPWVILALATNYRGKAKGVPARRRVLSISLQYSVIILVLSVFFCQYVQDKMGPLKLRPDNAYRMRTFPQEEFESEGKSYGIYPPIPFGPREQDRGAFFKPPLFRKAASEATESNDTFLHVLGTDDTGRDVLVEMIYGTRISMTIGIIAVGLYVTIGIVIGAVAGYFGGATDILISRIIEVFMLFPAFFLILILVAMIGPNIYIIMVVIGITRWPGVARLIRGEVLKQRAIEYVSAARALGASHVRIIFRHILPNALSPALVAAPFGIAGAIILEGGLSLLGYGVRPPTPSWGTLLRLGHGNYNYWWLIIVPSLAIFFCVTIFNLVGSGLRDAMDPKLRA